MQGADQVRLDPLMICGNVEIAFSRAPVNPIDLLMEVSDLLARISAGAGPRTKCLCIGARSINISTSLPSDGISTNRRFANCRSP
jgi:hypothetical protein